MSTRTDAPILLALSLLVGGCDERHVAAAPSTFVAFGRDFADFEGWRSFDRGLDRVPPTHDAHSVIYVDSLPESATDHFPVGTRIVRVEQHGEQPTQWELHAMVKRGGSFNASGATGWEFFELTLDGQRRPTIVWRGEGPASGDGYRAPEGGDLLGCNHCHASATYNDSVLSPVLSLSDFGTRSTR